MEPLPADNHVHDPGARAARAEHLVMKLARSKWVAAFVTAFAVSYAFHQVDVKSTDRIERQQKITTCTIEGVAAKQQLAKPGTRVPVQPILDQCIKQVGK